jgi:hypothetical protein
MAPLWQAWPFRETAELHVTVGTTVRISAWSHVIFTRTELASELSAKLQPDHCYLQDTAIRRCIRV